MVILISFGSKDSIQYYKYWINGYWAISKVKFFLFIFVALFFLVNMDFAIFFNFGGFLIAIFFSFDFFLIYKALLIIRHFDGIPHQRFRWSKKNTKNNFVYSKLIINWFVSHFHDLANIRITSDLSFGKLFFFLVFTWDTKVNTNKNRQNRINVH